MYIIIKSCYNYIYFVELLIPHVHACAARGKVIRSVIGMWLYYVATKKILNGTLSVDLRFYTLDQWWKTLPAIYS